MSTKDRDQLVLKWMGLAIWYAQHHFTEDTRFDFEERRSVAYLALIRAAERYDAAKGFSFGSYAGTVIYRSLRKQAYIQGSQMKRPSESRKGRVEELKQQSLGAFAENQHSYDPGKELDDRDHVDWIMGQLDEQEYRVANGIMEGRKYAEIDLPATGCNATTSSRRSRVAYIKKKFSNRITALEEGSETADWLADIRNTLEYCRGRLKLCRDTA